MLQQTITYSTTNDGSDCQNLVLDDSTGTWAAGTNEGGYQDEGGDASGNPKRSEVAVYVLLTKKNPEATDADVEYVNEDSSADTVDEWTIAIPTDGWYRGQLVTIPIWAASTAYALGQVIWFTDVVYVCAIAANADESPATNPEKWTALLTNAETLRDIYDNPVANGPTATIYTTYLDFLQHCYGDETYADAWKDVSDDRPSYYTTDAATAITALLEGAKIAAARENYQEADRKILIVQDLGNNPNCKSC